MSSKVMADYFSKKIRYEGDVLKPRAMIAELLREYGIESFEMLPAYLYTLRVNNIGTVYDIHMTSDHHFKFMFVALGVCISAFRQYMRPVVVVNGTHLKEKSKGVLFVAVIKDGNEKCFPLAVGVGPIENDESWIWFVQHFKMGFGTRDDLVIISDQHQSIKNSVARVYPDAHHGFCYYHIAKNHTRHGKHLIAMFKKAAYAYKQESFVKYMSMIVRNETARLPICSLIEVVRSVTEIWFDKRRELVVSRDHMITEEAYKKLSKEVEKGRHFVSRQTTAYTYKVKDAERSFVVDLQHHSCDCGEFQLDQMPCSHATTAIRSAGHNMYDYVEYYYKQWFANLDDQKKGDTVHQLKVQAPGPEDNKYVQDVEVPDITSPSIQPHMLLSPQRQMQPKDNVNPKDAEFVEKLATPEELPL
ncbi:hypothetical protein C2S53_004034 [Perilla frutescens var. hirtella]|uniref:SWIM-type domain-containing protein n=1 Tax=Perilla frutescens var. hirtella TaxID=608512 RepID=A0AAD4PBU6_PERFH|nr:hypothetical protein C2S53_004034 [Perilla frutescens var. hirtella]